MNRFRTFACAFCCAYASLVSAGATKVTFGGDGTVRVNGKPFFPIGIWVYNLDAAVMADLHDHHFNTIVGVGFGVSDLPLIEKNGMMCIPHATDDFLKAAKDSPSLLGWHLTDEPEEHNVPPADVHKLYDALKAKDADHPIGITHCQRAAPPKYKDSVDFTMTDVYPVDKNRVWPLKVVGDYTSATREVHGENWPTITIVQTFGGPDTDGGIWAQPLPSEVRFMVFNALVHRANGICYFSYWPRAPLTWAAVADINRDVRRIVPWLIAPGEEKPATSDDPAVEVRARKVGDGWIVIATNTEATARDVTLSVEALSDRTSLNLAYESRVCRIKAGKWRENFDAHEVKVYIIGDEPGWP